MDPNTFVYATGPINTVRDKTWNRPQVAGTAVHDLRGGGQGFAGQREEGFYADIASIFDLGALRPFLDYPDGNQGVDTFAGYNVQSIALQVPVEDLTAGKEPVIGIWSTASRQATKVFSAGAQRSSGRWVQVSRLGSPLVNEVVIPLKLKDAFNSLEPADDAATLTGVQAPPYSTEGDIPLVQDPILGAYIADLRPGHSRRHAHRPHLDLPHRHRGPEPCPSRQGQEEEASCQRPSGLPSLSVK